MTIREALKEYENKKTVIFEIPSGATEYKADGYYHLITCNSARAAYALLDVLAAEDDMSTVAWIAPVKEDDAIKIRIRQTDARIYGSDIIEYIKDGDRFTVREGSSEWFFNEITKELYDKLKDDKKLSGRVEYHYRLVENWSLIYGYGYYGAKVMEKDGKFYLGIKSGTSCE